MRRRRRVAALLLGSWLCAGAGSQAALATTLSGTVRDDGGRPLPGVTIDVRGDGLSAPKILYTDANGSYQLDGLSASTFQVSFRMPGFATLRKDVNVPSEGARLDSTLHLVASAEVVVTGKRTFRNLADLNEPVNDLLGIASASTVGVVTSKELDERESLRAADVLESVPGVVISQHSGEGKANQYYVRGFNIDHGTDLASTVAGVPVNMPTHAHGQGYSDNNFLIPELVSAIQYKKGPYYAEEGDFSAAGAINVNYVNVLDHPILKVDGGGEGYRRGLVAGSQDIGGAHVLLRARGLPQRRTLGESGRLPEDQRGPAVLDGRRRDGLQPHRDGLPGALELHRPGRGPGRGARPLFGLRNGRPDGRR